MVIVTKELNWSCKGPEEAAPGVLREDISSERLEYTCEAAATAVMLGAYLL